MIAVTYRQGLDEKAATSAAKRPGKSNGFFARALNAIHESQMRRARREIAMHRHLLPHDLEQIGNSLIRRNEDSLPFGR